jgi:hypothetical protein
MYRDVLTSVKSEFWEQFRLLATERDKQRPAPEEPPRSARDAQKVTA